MGAGVSEDVPLCGDLTCESPSCRQAAIDAYDEMRAADLRALFALELGQDAAR